MIDNAASIFHALLHQALMKWKRENKKNKKRARRYKGGEEGDTDGGQEVEERGGETWKIIRRNKNMGWE